MTGRTCRRRALPGVRQGAGGGQAVPLIPLPEESFGAALRGGSHLPSSFP